MTITTEQIKQLRDQTGISVMQCKKALEEAEGDMEKAVVILQKQSKATALKKGDRSLGSGVVVSYIHGAGSVGAMVELSCETDFVSRNEEFKKLAYDLAMQVAASNPEFIKREDVTEADKQKAKEVFTAEAAEKPAEMRAKIIEGKLDAFFDEKVFLEQNYIKDPSKKVKDLLTEAVQKFGEKTEVTRFARFAVGG